jgi:NADPH2:quinone reductase
MNAMLMTAPGDVDVLKLANVSLPQLSSAKQLLVRVHAAVVNPLDTKIRKLHFFYPNNLPVVLGVEGAGVVENAGAAVTRFKIGDEVYFFGNGLGAGAGSYAEYTLIEESTLLASRQSYRWWKPPRSRLC